MPGQAEAQAAANRAKAQAHRLELEHKARLAARWVDAWQVLAPEYEAALTEALSQADATGWVSPAVLRASRLEQALEHTKEQLAALVDGDVEDAREYTLPIMQTMVDGSTGALSAQLPASAVGVVAGWDRLDTSMVDAIVERTLGAVTARSAPLPGDVHRVIRDELTRGVAVGENPRAVARTMTRKAGARFTGGQARALNIARTEMLDAARTASQAHDAANTDVVAGWQWLASLDTRCCIGCAVMHGTFHPVEQVGPEGHPSCRCVRVPVAKGWGDLGIPGLDGDTELVIDPDAGRLWFENQSEGVQRQVMGSQARFDAYQAGRTTWGELATRQANPGWRDSIVPTRI